MCSTQSFGAPQKDQSLTNLVVEKNLTVCKTITADKILADKIVAIDFKAGSINGVQVPQPMVFPEKVLPLSRTIYVDGTSTMTGTPDGSTIHPFLTIQAALDFIGPATTGAEFQDTTQFAWEVVIGPGKYVEDLTIPLRADWTFDVKGVLIVGNVNIPITWPFTTPPLTPIFQMKYKFVGGDLNSAYQPGGPIMSLNAIQGNLNVIPNHPAGTSLFVQCHIINFGVQGVPGGASTNPPTGTGHIFLNGTPAGTSQCVLQLFMENAMLSGDFCVSNSSPNLQGTLFAWDSNDMNPVPSVGVAYGGVNGRVNLYSLHNIRFTRPVILTAGGATGLGTWTNVEFANDINNDMKSVPAGGFTRRLDHFSMRSFLKNIPLGNQSTNRMQVIDNINVTTAERTALLAKLPIAPVGPDTSNTVNIGFMVFDTDLNRPLWRSGASWILADGTVVP